LDHVVAGVALDSATIVDQVCTEVETVGGLKLAIKFEAAASAVTVNSIPVTDFNIEGDFGIMHGIEGVFVEGILGAFEPCPKPAVFDPLVTKGGYDTLIDLLIATESVTFLESNAPMSKLDRSVFTFSFTDLSHKLETDNHLPRYTNLRTQQSLVPRILPLLPSPTLQHNCRSKRCKESF
jgi:hypothetical protein